MHCNALIMILNAFSTFLNEFLNNGNVSCTKLSVHHNKYVDKINLCFVPVGMLIMIERSGELSGDRSAACGLYCASYILYFRMAMAYTSSVVNVQ